MDQLLKRINAIEEFSRDQQHRIDELESDKINQQHRINELEFKIDALEEAEGATKKRHRNKQLGHKTYTHI